MATGTKTGGTADATNKINPEIGQLHQNLVLSI